MTDLGKTLKEARESKGISLDELQSYTKIQKRYLLGIEEGDYSMMPGKFYVRAFIKQYAEAVGLDPEELFEHYKSDIPSTYHEELPEKLSRVQSRKTISRDTSKILDILPKLLFALIAIGVSVLVWYLIVKNVGNDVNNTVENNTGEVKIDETNQFEEKDDEKTDQNAVPDEDSSDDQNEIIEEINQEITVVSQAADSTVYELKNADQFVVKVVSLGQTWINIKNGSGKSEFQGTLKKGSVDESKTVDLSNDSKATIVVGFAPDTEIYINGQKLDFAIPPTERMRQDITIQFAKEQ